MPHVHASRKRCFAAPWPTPQAVCPAAGQKQGSLFTLGSVGRCLSKAVAEARRLTPGCKALVLVAAPRDARSIVADSSASVDTVALKVAEVRLSCVRQGEAGVWGACLQACQLPCTPGVGSASTHHLPTPLTPQHRL